MSTVKGVQCPRSRALLQGLLGGRLGCAPDVGSSSLSQSSSIHALHGLITNSAVQVTPLLRSPSPAVRYAAITFTASAAGCV